MVQSPHVNAMSSQKRVAIVSALLQSVPLSLGAKLRWLFYRNFFARMDANVTIECGVEFVLPQVMQLEEDVSIGRFSRLNCWQPGSKLIIRKNSKFGQSVQLSPLGGTIEIGENVCFDSFICLAGPGNISIGNNCLIASHCGMYANNHVFDDPHRLIRQQPLTCEGITIGDDCWIGTGVRVLDGVTIGKGSVIGAGAVVTKDIPPYSVAVGVPAKVISKRGKESMGYSAQQAPSF
jgi:acetyltransferase-like isoleucine patch superfamily enzyme